MHLGFQNVLLTVLANLSYWACFFNKKHRHFSYTCTSNEWTPRATLYWSLSFLLYFTLFYFILLLLYIIFLILKLHFYFFVRFDLIVMVEYIQKKKLYHEKKIEYGLIDTLFLFVIFQSPFFLTFFSAPWKEKQINPLRHTCFIFWLIRFWTGISTLRSDFEREKDGWGLIEETGIIRPKVWDIYFLLYRPKIPENRFYFYLYIL